MIWLIAPAALATPVSDDEVVAAVEYLYGKELPEGAVCISRPTNLPGRFKDTVVAGVKRGARGCVVVGGLIEDRLVPTKDAAAAAIDADAWDMVDDAQRAEDLAAWTDAVLLAFDQPEQPGDARPDAGGFAIQRTYLHRGDKKGVSVRSAGTWTFDASGNLTEHTDAAETAYQTQLSVRPDKLDGVSQDVVQEVMTGQGRRISDCFADAWDEDLSLSGAVRLAWKITEGKSDDLKLIIDPGEPSPESLAKCYAHAIRQLEFPKGVVGSVGWVFVADRREQ